MLIVGYGPVGQTLAALLASKGHRVDVYERFSCLYDLPRAVYFDDEIMQVWQSLGIADELDVLPINTYNWFGADGEHDPAHGAPGLGPSGWEPGYLFYQPTLEHALDRARALAAHRHRALRLERGVARAGRRLRRGDAAARARAAHRRTSSRPTRRRPCAPAT